MLKCEFILDRNRQECGNAFVFPINLVAVEALQDASRDSAHRRSTSGILCGEEQETMGERTQQQEPLEQAGRQQVVWQQMGRQQLEMQH